MTMLEAVHNLMPMNAASLSFVFLYLPVCLLAYYALPASMRQAVLLASSLGFIALGGVYSLPVLLASAAADFFLVKLIVLLADKPLSKAPLLLCIAKNLGLMIYFGVSAQLSGSPHAFWIFVVSISGIQVALSFYRGEITAKLKPLVFFNYAIFFPRLSFGPLAEYESFAAGNEGIDINEMLSGLSFFAGGLLKYAVIGAGLSKFCSMAGAVHADYPSVLSSWGFVVSTALAVYFTFSGLCDIARGVSSLFGIRLPQNFYYPYQSRSLSDFFERFNMTLTSFLKKTVLTPLDTGKDDAVADSLNIVLIGMLWGIWFGARLNYAVWGAMIAAFIIMEKYFYKKLLSDMPTLFCRVYAFFVVILSFSVFAGSTLSESADILKSMLGFGEIESVSGQILYLIASNWLLLIVALFYSTNAASLLAGLIKKTWPVAARPLFLVIDCCAMLVFAAFALVGWVA